MSDDATESVHEEPDIFFRSGGKADPVSQTSSVSRVGEGHDTQDDGATDDGDD